MRVKLLINIVALIVGIKSSLSDTNPLYGNTYSGFNAGGEEENYVTSKFYRLSEITYFRGEYDCTYCCGGS